MKKEFKIAILIFILFIGIGKYLPFSNCPISIKEIYYNYGLIILVIAILSTLFFVINWKLNIYIKVLFILTITIIISFTNRITNFNNMIIIKYNEEREIMKSPIIGVMLDTNSHLGDDVFIFNKKFGVYDALIYSPNHGLEPDSWEFKNESSYYKVYNKNWWWYKHND